MTQKYGTDIQEADLPPNIWKIVLSYSYKFKYWVSLGNCHECEHSRMVAKEYRRF